jgi:4-amino-4-deoxy-L-arabinose transferase
MAVLPKWLAALLVPAVWIVMLRAARRREAAAPALALGVAAAVALPWHLYARLRYPLEYAWERAYDTRHLVEALEGHGGPAWFHLAWMGRFYGELVYLPVAWFLLRAARERGWGRLGVAAWFVLPYAFFSLAATKMPAYVMIAAPALFLMQGWYWWRVRDWVGGSARRWPAYLLLAALVILPARYAVERVRPFSADRRTRPWAQQLKALGERLGSGPCVVLNVPRPVEAMFYTPCVAYPSALDAATAAALQRRGYRVLAQDDGRLPTGLLALPGVEGIRLAPD